MMVQQENKRWTTAFDAILVTGAVLLAALTVYGEDVLDIKSQPLLGISVIFAIFAYRTGWHVYRYRVNKQNSNFEWSFIYGFATSVCFILFVAIYTLSYGASAY